MDLQVGQIIDLTRTEANSTYDGANNSAGIVGAGDGANSVRHRLNSSRQDGKEHGTRGTGL